MRSDSRASRFKRLWSMSASEIVPLEEMVEAVSKVCRRAGKRGPTMALEFIADTGLPSLPFAQTVAEGGGEQNCASVLD
jgi:hypothetical protein